MTGVRAQPLSVCLGALTVCVSLRTVCVLGLGRDAGSWGGGGGELHLYNLNLDRCEARHEKGVRVHV